MMHKQGIHRITSLYHIAGCFPQVQIFPNDEPLVLAEIFPIQKFTSPTMEKSHLSDISYKAYMGKTIICRTFAMSTVIIGLYLCMVTTCTCVCTGVSITLRFSKAYTYVHKESSLIWPNSFLAQGVYHLQYQHPAKALSMVVRLHSYLYVLNYLTGLAHNCMQHILHSASYQLLSP